MIGNGAMQRPPQYPRREAVRGSRGTHLAARAALLIAAAALLTPVLFVLASLGAKGGEVQQHIWTTTGPRYFAGTLALAGLVAVISGAVGASTAALIALTRFPGRGLVSIALVLPFAVPAYITAYAYADFLGPFGAVATWLGGPGAPWTLNIRSLGGAAFVLSLSVYSYVYLAMRASLESRSAALLESARALGAHPASAVWRALLPPGRAAFAGGLALALMETVADFGVAEYYGVATLSVGVFRTWYGFGDLIAASQIASGLFLIAVFLVLLEAASRRGSGADHARAVRDRAAIRLNGAGAVAALCFCAIPPILGFVVPASVLVAKLGAAAPATTLNALWPAALNTATIAGVGAAIGIAAALILALAARAREGLGAALMLRVATLGYALPGAMIAIGALAGAAALRAGAGIAISGFALLAYALVIRFMTAGYNLASAGLAQLHPLAEDAARTLGAGPARIALQIQAPLSARALAAGCVIIFIDIAKELPATLLLRPFNFETLATQVYRLASDERLADAAPGALTLIAVSLAPVLVLNLTSTRAPAQRPASTAAMTASQM